MREGKTLSSTCFCQLTTTRLWTTIVSFGFNPLNLIVSNFKLFTYTLYWFPRSIHPYDFISSESKGQKRSGKLTLKVRTSSASAKKSGQMWSTGDNATRLQLLCKMRALAKREEEENEHFRVFCLYISIDSHFSLRDNNIRIIVTKGGRTRD